MISTGYSAYSSPPLCRQRACAWGPSACSSGSSELLRDFITGVCSIFLYPRYL